MKKHAIISVVLIALFILIPIITHAATFVSSTTSFGGRVISTSNPAVTCVGLGVGPVILSTNLNSLGSAISSGVSNNQSSSDRAGGVINGLYGAIPYFAKISFSAGVGGVAFVSTPPKVGDWILGRASIIPEFSTCYIPYLSLPFPVKDTRQYNVSRHGPTL
jgi:hypothetical protein